MAFSLESEWQQVSSSFQDSGSILADLNNAVVCIVSTSSLFSKSSSPCTNPLVTVPTHQLQLQSPLFSCSIVFFQLWGLGTNLSLCFPSILPCDQLERQSQLFCRFSFLLTFPRFVLLLLFYPFESFSHQRQLRVFHWGLSDSKYPQVLSTLLSFLADLNNVVVWMAFIRVLISNFSSTFTNSLVTVPSTPITIGITVTFTFHSVFQFPSKV